MVLVHPSILTSIRESPSSIILRSSGSMSEPDLSPSSATSFPRRLMSAWKTKPLLALRAWSHHRMPPSPPKMQGHTLFDLYMLRGIKAQPNIIANIFCHCLTQRESFFHCVDGQRNSATHIHRFPLQGQTSPSLGESSSSSSTSENKGRAEVATDGIGAGGRGCNGWNWDGDRSCNSWNKGEIEGVAALLLRNEETGALALLTVPLTEPREKQEGRDQYK